MESSVTDWKTWISGSILPSFRGISFFSSASLFPQQNGNAQNGVGARTGVKMGGDVMLPPQMRDLHVGKGVFTPVMA